MTGIGYWVELLRYLERMRLIGRKSDKQRTIGIRGTIDWNLLHPLLYSGNGHQMNFFRNKSQLLVFRNLDPLTLGPNNSETKRWSSVNFSTTAGIAFGANVFDQRAKNSRAGCRTVC